MAKTTGVDLDALLATHQKGPIGPKCRVCIVLDTVPADWRSKLQAALDDRERYSGRNLCDIINALGVTTSTGMVLEVGHNAVDRHRRRACLTTRGHG